jgi:hypothetical protein
MTRYANINHGLWAKRGFLLGLGLLLLGVAGEIVGHALFGSLPGWENTFFHYSEGIGILIGFFAPAIFGIALPLVDS